MIKVLAIDDINDNLISLKAIINDAFPDSVLYTALNGQKGIELAVSEDPDVILLDIIMPEMDGFEVCRLLKLDQNTHDIPVVFLTAIKGNKETRIKALETGAEGFLSKPIDETELTAQIRAMVKIKEAGKQKRDEEKRLKRLVAERTHKLELSQIATLNLLEELKAENEIRKKTEEALRESEERFVHLFQRAPLGYQSLDENGYLLDVNEAWLTTLGYSREEVRGKWFGDFLAPQFVGAFRERFPLFKNLGQIHSEFEMIHKSGKHMFIAFEGRIGHKDDGSFEQTHCILQDITERKRASEILQESEERFRHISSSISDISYSCKINSDGISAIDWLCGATEQITGYTIAELFELKCWGKLVVDEDFHLFNKHIIELSPDSSEICELRLQKKNGDIVWIQASAERVKNRNSSGPDSIYGCLVDISHRKKIESELIAAKEKAEENDRLKSAFLANMSHEIRTPLNSIIGFSELMTDPDFDNSQQFQFARLINISGNNLLTIISDIMDFSKIEAGQISIKKRLQSVNKLISDIQKEYSYKAAEKGIELRIDSPNHHDEIFIESDEHRLRQILINFVGNSLKFTENGFIEIGAKIAGEFVQFHVKDTGIGIPPEFHDKIFERFRQVEIGSTRKYGGNGLGLSISKSLVELLGGKIWVESEPGKGSTFYFAVPK